MPLHKQSSLSQRQAVAPIQTRHEPEKLVERGRDNLVHHYRTLCGSFGDNAWKTNGNFTDPPENRGGGEKGVENSLQFQRCKLLVQRCIEHPFLAMIAAETTREKTECCPLM